ncbi:MAG: hypothetical protein UX07_C0022G0005 [Parcubacteria group bacterium GW2011_GWA2_45_30]|nr:MAG: hypothetical protein UX07_C0022G0005 [Parcubacteria group bacterium GW2011_GWA2_45_30]
MTRLAGACLILALFICPEEIAGKDHYELTFVASNEEVDIALNKSEALRGLAVRNEFYDAADQKTKEKMDNLVNSIKNNLQPIFIYGQSLRLEILESWFPQAKGYFRCQPTMAGAFSTLPVNEELQNSTEDGYLPGKTFLMCDPDDTAKSEQEFREYISAFWLTEKQDIREEGYATLN